MKFLIKIEEAINQFIIRFLNKLIVLTPHFFFDWASGLSDIRHYFKDAIHLFNSKLNIVIHNFKAFLKKLVITVRSKITSLIIYLRSEDFKKTNKIEILLIPYKYTKANPSNILSVFFAVILLSGAGLIIFKNTEKIIIGTKYLRKPASIDAVEEDLFITLKNNKSEVKIGDEGAHGGGHGAAAEDREYEIYLDITLEAQNSEEKEFLEDMKEMLEDNIEALELKVDGLPLTSENKIKIEETMTLSLNDDIKLMGHPMPIKKIKIKQALPGRQKYYRQQERMFSINDINLQIFLEDTHRNRQVWLDFSILASNRNIILYLKEHEIELKDQLTTNVEPVIPQLPLEKEGSQIIKDKIKMELNIFIKKNNIEGEVLDIYIDYIVVS